MTPTLRTAILDALMERWRDASTPDWVATDDAATLSCEQSLAYLTLLAPIQREFFASCLDMILPVAEPMIREAALREAADVAGTLAEGPYGDEPEFSAVMHVEQTILDFPHRQTEGQDGAMTREDEIRAEIERRLANERRIYAKRRADALLVLDMPKQYRRSPIGVDPPKSYGSPWMEPRRR